MFCCHCSQYISSDAGEFGYPHAAVSLITGLHSTQQPSKGILFLWAACERGMYFMEGGWEGERAGGRGLTE